MEAGTMMDITDVDSEGGTGVLEKLIFLRRK